jgi:hypothetical protein
MFAEVVLDFKPRVLHFHLQQIGDQGHAAAAAGSRRRAFFDGSDISEVVVLNRGANLALGDVIAGADLGAVGEAIDAHARGFAAAFRQDQVLGMGR